MKQSIKVLASGTEVGKESTDAFEVEIPIECIVSVDEASFPDKSVIELQNHAWETLWCQDSVEEIERKIREVTNETSR